MNSLEDKMFSRISFVFPIITGIIAFIIAIFLWYIGKSQREAYNAAKEYAESTANRVVSEIVKPNEIKEEIESLFEEIDSAVEKLKRDVIHDVTLQLTNTKEEILKNKQKIIEESLNEQIKTKFEKEFDIMERLQNLEVENEKLSSTIEPLLQLALENYEAEYLRSFKNFDGSISGMVRATHAIPAYLRYSRLKKQLKQTIEENK